jgi:multiple sugar transport system ATP-binding protein
VIAGLRPEHISCGLNQGKDIDTIEVIECRVDVLEPTGPDTMMFVGINDSVVTSRVRPDEVKPVGETKHLDIQMAKMHFFDAHLKSLIQ